MESKSKGKETIVETYENVYQKLENKNIKNPFKDFNGEVGMNELLKKVGSDRMVGILHSFILLKDQSKFIFDD